MNLTITILDVYHVIKHPLSVAICEKYQAKEFVSKSGVLELLIEYEYPVNSTYFFTLGVNRDYRGIPYQLPIYRYPPEGCPEGFLRWKCWYIFVFFFESFINQSTIFII